MTTLKPAQKTRTKVFIVDDHATIRYGVRQLLESDPEMEVLGEAASVYDAFQAIDKAPPHVLIVDIRLEDGSGLELIERVRALHPEVKVLVYTMYDDSIYADRALRAGALGYLNKGEKIDSLLTAVRQVSEGKTSLSDDMNERLITRMFRPGEQASASPIEALSNREMEVFELMGAGMTRSEIAHSLHISTKTIESHQQKIKQKLMLKSNQELFRRAVEWCLRQGEST